MWISIDTKSSIPLTRQLQNKIKDMILDGSLASEEKLPSSRALSRELCISRNTVLEVYDQLIAEGYLEARHGSGTIVSAVIPKRIKEREFKSPEPLQTYHTEYDNLIDFRSGVPDLEFFPRVEWGRLYRRLINELPSSSLRYHNPAGVHELRDEISQYLYHTRGIRCSSHNIMIVSGSTQGLSLISKLLYQEQKEVIVEDPVHSGLVKVITSAGFHVTGIPVDEHGIRADLLLPSDHTSFIYTTPSHQYPLGGILPLKRRISLIQYATDNNCYILEDDYDSEFRYEGQPVNSLYELNPEKVIYLGSFSKILAPAIRLGFILLPEELIDQYKLLKMYTDVHTEVISQYVLAEFIKTGGLEKHIYRMKKLYNKKREHLLQELKSHFSEEYEIKGQAAGLHVTVKFTNITFTEELLNQIYSSRIRVYPVENYTLYKTGEYDNEIILGYGHLSLSEITEGIRILRDILHS